MTTTVKILAIDPALRSTGIAWFHSGKLEHATQVRVPPYKKADGTKAATGFRENDAVAEAAARLWSEMASAPWGPVNDGQGWRVIIEDPFQAGIPGGWRGAATGRFTAAAFGMVVAHSISIYPDAHLQLVPVRQWKGSYGFLPSKNRGKKQIIALEKEYAATAFPNQSFPSHDARVAALLGLFSLTASRWSGS